MKVCSASLYPGSLFLNCKSKSPGALQLSSHAATEVVLAFIDYITAISYHAIQAPCVKHRFRLLRLIPCASFFEVSPGTPALPPLPQNFAEVFGMGVLKSEKCSAAVVIAAAAAAAVVVVVVVAVVVVVVLVLALVLVLAAVVVAAAAAASCWSLLLVVVVFRVLGFCGFHMQVWAVFHGSLLA